MTATASGVSECRWLPHRQLRATLASRPGDPAAGDDGTFPCQVFEGATAARMLALFGSASMATRWV